MTVTTNQAITLLENVLFESSTQATANASFWVGISNLNSAYSTVAGLAGYLATQPEVTIAQQVVRYYEGALGRVPSPSEINFYVSYIEKSLTPAQISQGASGVSSDAWGQIAGFFTNSTEFKTDFGLTGGITASNEALVITGFYTNVLGRAPTSAEITFYENAISSGVATPTTLLEFFTNSTEYQAKVNGQIATNLGAAGVTAVTTAAAGGDPLASTTPIGPVTSATPTTTALTTGVDAPTLSGSNNVINGSNTDATLSINPLDNITVTGAGSGNVLNLSDSKGGSVDFSALTISGVQTVNYTSSNDLLNTTNDFSGFSGLTALNVKLGAVAQDNVIVAAGTTAVSVTDTEKSGSSQNLTVKGGSTITVNQNDNNNAGGTITVVGSASATTAVTVKQTNANTSTGTSVLISDPNHTSTTASSTIASVTLSGLTGGTTSQVQSNALTSLTVASSNANVTVTAAAGTRTLGLTLNGDTGGTITDATATTLNITASTTKSSGVTVSAAAAKAVTIDAEATLGLTSLSTNVSKSLAISGTSVVTLGAITDAALTAVTVSGKAGLTADLSGLAALTSVTTTSSGVVTVTINDTQESFAGGTGQDIVTVTAAATKSVVGGTATNNEIVLKNIAAASASTVSTVSNFQVLGVAGTTTGTFDMSKAAGYTAFDVQASGGAITFTNATAGSTLAVDGVNANIITLQTADSTGATDSTTLSLGTTKVAAFTAAQVTLEDSQFVGIGNVAVASNNKTGAVNTVTTLGDNNLVSLTLTGTAGLAVGTALADVATGVTLTNNSASTVAGLTLNGLTDNFLSTLTFNGTSKEGISLGALTSTATSLTVVDNEAGAVSITNADTSLKSATFTNSVNTKAGTFTVSSAVEAALATLTLNGNVAIGITGDAVTGGITVAGSTDNANVTFTSTGATGKAITDSVVLGSGGDTVVLGTGAGTSTQTVTLGNSTANSSVATSSIGTVNITVGTAAAGITETISTTGAGVTATIVSGDASTSGATTVTAAGVGDTLHITLGNANDVITATGGTDTTTITVGTGANTITTGVGDTATITVGTHTGIDAITVGASSATQAIVSINGLNNAKVDTITFAAETASTLVGFTQTTAAMVVADGGNTTLLASWIKAADDSVAHGGTGGAAHSVNWFQFQGNTYIVESVAGATVDAGTWAAGNTVVELVGTGYTFAHTTGALGTLHLLG